MAADSVTPTIPPGKLESDLVIFRRADELYIGRYHVNGHFYGVQYERRVAVLASEVTVWRPLDMVLLDCEK